jgi:hypothetical protein
MHVWCKCLFFAHKMSCAEVIQLHIYWDSQLGHLVFRHVCNPMEHLLKLLFQSVCV